MDLKIFLVCGIIVSVASGVAAGEPTACVLWAHDDTTTGADWWLHITNDSTAEDHYDVSALIARFTDWDATVTGTMYNLDSTPAFQSQAATVTNGSDIDGSHKTKVFTFATAADGATSYLNFNGISGGQYQANDFKIKNDGSVNCGLTDKFLTVAGKSGTAGRFNLEITSDLELTTSHYVKVRILKDAKAPQTAFAGAGKLYTAVGATAVAADVSSGNVGTVTTSDKLFWDFKVPVPETVAAGTKLHITYIDDDATKYLDKDAKIFVHGYATSDDSLVAISKGVFTCGSTDCPGAPAESGSDAAASNISITSIPFIALFIAAFQ